MPRPPTLPPDRFFARVDRFVCECPRCGLVIQVNWAQDTGDARELSWRRERRGRASQIRVKGDRSHDLIYNPLTSRLTCPACRVSFGIGLVAYPLVRRAPSRQPSDQKPTWQQMLALRQRSSGYLSAEPIKGDDPVNVACVAECTCPDTASWHTGCPIHGIEATRSARTGDESHKSESRDFSDLNEDHKE